MKILFLEQFSELGGGQRNLLDLLPEMIARGWSTCVAAPGSGPLFDCARRLGTGTAQIHFGDYSNGRKSLADAARFPFDAMRLARWIAEADYDVMSAGGPRLLPAVALGARGRPVIFQAQHFLRDPFALRATKWAIRRSHATVIANSGHVAMQFKARHVVYNGVAKMPFRRRSFDPRTTRFGIIGRIAPMKGQTDFLRAAQVLHANLPDTRFVICGAPMFSSVSYIEEVNRLAARLPVDFLGWRDDVAAVFDEIDILIAPSTPAEATTRVILEAFAAGVPVVAYAAGGIPEIIRDGETGFLVPECTPDMLARKVLDVFSRDLSKIIAAARLDWERNYTLERYQRQMADLIEQAARIPVTSPILA